MSTLPYSSITAGAVGDLHLDEHPCLVARGPREQEVSLNLTALFEGRELLERRIESRRRPLGDERCEFVSKFVRDLRDPA